MHELGIVIEMVKLVDEIKEENKLTEIDSVVLDIGVLSDVLPDYLTECWNCVNKDTYLEKTQLQINRLPAVVRCNSCNNEYNITPMNTACPKCNDKNYQIISGREFDIKEIVAK